MTNKATKSPISADSWILACGVALAFGCIADAQGASRSPVVPEAAAAGMPDAVEIGGEDGVYVGSSFTGHRSVGEFGIEIRQQSAGFASQVEANTLLRITTYSFLRGDASLERRVRVHAGTSCFSRGNLIAARDLRTAAVSPQADEVTEDYFNLDVSLAERVLVYEVREGERWVESNCTVTQPDQA